MQQDGAPSVEPGADGFARVAGLFHRAVDPAHCAAALAGSRAPARYSAADQPTLYISASPAGVAAAMVAHRERRASLSAIVRLHVAADAIVDLRDAAARRRFAVELDAATAPWQAIVGVGGEPPSWRVRRHLERAGAAGLIDPSRQAPGLWHLVLFRWNMPGAPAVTLLD